MAWELLVDSDRDTGVFICNTADVAFGPLIRMEHSDVGTFYEWWNEVIGKYNDPRTMDSSDLSNAIYRWYGVQYEVKFQITIPAGDNVSKGLAKKVFTGEYYPVDYCNIKGIYDDEITEEDHKYWSMEDWDKTKNEAMAAARAAMLSPSPANTASGSISSVRISAIRGKCSSGVPMWKSAPRGSAISSR